MRVAIVDCEIHPSELLKEVATTANGAAVLFMGTVREVNQGRAVAGMQYSAYVPMAQRELHDIVREAANRFDTEDLVVEHRIGSLALGEASVGIAAAHPHRAAAFDAARYIIEQLKQRVPVWKLEEYVDGEREWVAANESAEPTASVATSPTASPTASVGASPTASPTAAPTGSRTASAAGEQTP